MTTVVEDEPVYWLALCGLWGRFSVLDNWIDAQ